MDQIRFNHKDDGYALASVAGAPYNPLVDISICRLKDDRRLGGVLFSNYTDESIAIHSASWHPRWINRDLLWVTFDYPFNQLGVNRIFGMVPEDNLAAQKFNYNLGFRLVTRIEGVYKGNITCLVMCLERNECRFLSLKPRTLKAGHHLGNGHGEEIQSASGSRLQPVGERFAEVS